MALCAPINFTAHLVLTTLGLAGFCCCLPRLVRIVRDVPRRPLAFCVLGILPVVIWLANRATGPNAEYDAGLYHIAAIKWTKLYFIVPGLANLHMRLGFSSTITLLSGADGPGFGRAMRVIW